MKHFSVVVCGIFHYKHIIKKISESPFFDRIYFSHKVSSLRMINDSHKVNIFIKEYLYYAIILVFGYQARPFAFFMGHFLWNMFGSIVFRPSQLNFIILHGVCIPFVKKAKREGCLVVGEAVNAHPLTLNRILIQDAEWHGIKSAFDQKTIEKKLSEIALVDYMLVASTSIAQSYIENGFPKDKIFVIPYGIDSRVSIHMSNKVKHIKKESEVIKIICVGQIVPRKGQYHLLKALEQYAHNDISLTLLGVANPDYFSKLLPQKVKLTHIEHMPHVEVLKFIDQFDVLCLNSLEDGFGMVVTEAISVGTPVVVSKYTGASEFVEYCGGGIIVDPLNYNEVVEAIYACAAGKYPEPNGKLRTWDDYSDDFLKLVEKL